MTWTYTHDAWNRLVKVVSGANTLSEFQYNGLDWCIVKTSDTDADGSLDQRRFRYYDAEWQLVEERIDDESTFPAYPDDTDIDPVLASIALLNLLTNGQAAKRMNISREELNKGFLVRHSMQHYQTILGTLRTWRQIPDWLAIDALPAWVRNGASS